MKVDTEREKVTAATPAEIGAAIRGRRKELGLTQGDLAMVANTSLRFVSEVERGKPTARLAGVLRLLDALGLRLWLGRR